MGVVDLKPDEQVMFPAPYEDGQVYPVVVTNHRIVTMSVKGGRGETEISKVSFVGRHAKRPLLFPGIMMLVLGLPALVYAIYLFVSVMDMKALDPEEQVAADDVEDPGKVRIKGAIIGVVGLLVGAGGVLMIRKRKLSVVCNAGKKKIKIPVEDKTEQQQVMMTVQAGMNASKQQAKMKEQQAAAMAQAQAAAAAAVAAAQGAAKVQAPKAPNLPNNPLKK